MLLRPALSSSLALLLFGGCPGPDTGDAHDTAPVAPAPFTLVVVPDTQYYTLGHPTILDDMLAWAASDSGATFLLHEGDVTHNNSQEEWDNARASFDLLEGALPYAVCVGNHDLDEDGGDALFDATFPVEGVSGEPWFGGTLEPGSLANAWFTFEAGGTDWLVLSLTYAADSDTLAWADGVLADHPDRRTIVLTHAYLSPDGDLTTIGLRIWQVLKLHPQVSFVFNGHYIDGEAAYSVKTGDAGNSVHQLFFNVQDRLFGGQGLLRTMLLDPVAGTVDVRTYSPWLDWYEEAEEHQFVIEGVALAAP